MAARTCPPYQPEPLEEKKVSLSYLKKYIKRQTHRYAVSDPAYESPVVARLQRLVSKLAEPYRSVLVLRYTEGLSDDEIARILGISEGSVRVYFHRALSEVRRRFKR
jgi:RNA polymerase sigma factor (sigma-70 family)